MNARRFTCFFLGAWLAAGAMVAFLTLRNNRSLDSILTSVSPAVSAQLKAAGAVQARALFALQASEQNRLYREDWGNVQIAAGIFFFFFLLFATREGKAALTVAGVLLLVVVLQRMLLVPEISALTNLLRSGEGTGVRRRLFALTMTYHAVEALKMIVGGAVAVILIREGRYRSRYAGQNVDVIDKPDHRHIDR